MKQTFNSKKKAVLITTHERSVMPRKKPKDQLSTTRPKRQQLSNINNSAARVYYNLYLKHKWYNMFYFILKSCYLHFSFLLFPSFGFKCFFFYVARSETWPTARATARSVKQEIITKQHFTSDVNFKIKALILIKVFITTIGFQVRITVNQETRHHCLRIICTRGDQTRAACNIYPSWPHL